MKRIFIILASFAFLPGPVAAEEPHAPMSPAPAPTTPLQAPKPTKGYVLQVKDKIVYLDLGMRDNVRVGDTFEIIRDEEIVHPITGENLGGKATVGVVKVTQVFEKLSVAEIVSVLPGATMAKLDRIRMGNEPMEPPPPLSPPVEPPSNPMEMTEKKDHEGELARNPDGVLRGLDVGLGGGYETKQKTRMMGGDILIPLTRRFTVGWDYGYSQESHADTTRKLSESKSEQEFGGKLRIYLGRWMRKGEDINPDGDVGSAVLDLGGGTRRLKDTTEQPIIIDGTTTPPDIRTLITPVKTNRSALNFGVLLPMAQRWTFGMGYDWEKDLSRVNGWVRYYTSAIDPDWMGANPDGKIGSFVVTLFSSYNSKGTTAKKWMGFDLKIPMSGMFTFGLTYGTNRKFHRVRGGLNVHLERKLL